MRSRFNLVLRAALTITALFSMAWLAMFAFSGWLTATQASMLLAIGGSILGTMATLYALQVIRTLGQNPATLQVALIGKPRSGKTVYLTVLFRELQTLHSGSILFSPYGVETIEEVARNIKTLGAGRWLAATTSESIFFFRANVRIGSGFFLSRYTLEIGDYAGERIAEFDSSDVQFIHRTEYFKWSTTADLVMLSFDGANLAFGDRNTINQEIQTLTAAVQVLSHEKTRGRSKLRFPVALLVLKSDLLRRANVDLAEAHRRLDPLIAVCRHLCQTFEVFFVSAVGTLSEEDEVPPPHLLPYGVVEPMLWALKRAYKRAEDPDSGRREKDGRSLSSFERH